MSFAKLFSLLRTVSDWASGLRCYLLQRKWANVTKMNQSEMSRLLLGASSDFVRPPWQRQEAATRVSPCCCSNQKGPSAFGNLLFLHNWPNNSVKGHSRHCLLSVLSGCSGIFVFQVNNKYLYSPCASFRGSVFSLLKITLSAAGRTLAELQRENQQGVF